MRLKADVRVDTSGLARPQPVLRARKALDEMSPGQVLEIAAIGPGNGEDVETYIGRVGHELIGVSTEGETTRFYIRKVKQS
jgi:TusA-related sulfurtransferase